MNLPEIGAISILIIISSIAQFSIFTYTQEVRVAQDQINSTVTEILERQAQRWKADNIRFNATLLGLAKTYDLIVDNQKRIINLTNLQIQITDFQNNNTQKNLNLTKFNRAELINTNELVREIAKQLNITTLKPFTQQK